MMRLLTSHRSLVAQFRFFGVSVGDKGAEAAADKRASGGVGETKRDNVTNCQKKRRRDVQLNDFRGRWRGLAVFNLLHYSAPVRWRVTRRRKRGRRVHGA